jgi:hypothetical protein
MQMKVEKWIHIKRYYCIGANTKYEGVQELFVLGW